MYFVNSTGNFYTGDMAEGDREATPAEIAAWEAARADTPAKWQGRAKEKARVTINDARKAVSNMIAKRLDADPVKAQLQTLPAQLLALIPSTDLSASTDETSAFNILWAAYTPLVGVFPLPIRAEYKLEYDLLTKPIV